MKRGLLIALCLVLAVAAAPADAKKKGKKKGLGPVVTVTTTGNVASAVGENSTATATCPSGLQAVGGGYTAPATPTGALVIINSFRSASQSWTATARRLNGSAAVTAYAYCRKASKSITDVPAGISATNSGQVVTATAPCPAGTRLVGGGFQSTAGPTASDILVMQANSSPSTGTWQVTALNNTSADQNLLAHAYCMSGIKPPTVVTGSGSASVPQFGTIPATSSTCPKPKKKKGKKKKPAQLLSAGGFFGPVGTPGGAVAVYGDSRIGPTGGWLAIGINATSNPGTLPVTAQGLCF